MNARFPGGETPTQLPYAMSSAQATLLVSRGLDLFVRDFTHIIPFEKDENLVRRTIESDLLAYAPGFQRPGPEGVAGVISVSWPSHLALIQRLSSFEGLHGQEDAVLTYLFVDQQLHLVQALCYLKGIFPQVKMTSIHFSALSVPHLEGLFQENAAFSEFLPYAFEDLAGTLFSRVNDRDLVHVAWQRFCTCAREEVGIIIHPL